ncbi:MAG: type I pantothenate kinase [Chloroflexi bacterium]|nr:type I pantothenate kinase [Chloroflexota bacterium]
MAPTPAINQDDGTREHAPLSRYVDFARGEWAQLRNGTKLPLTEGELQALVGLNDRVSLDEVADTYLPLTRLLRMYVESARELYGARARFLGNDSPRVPFVIGVAGSVAVGKSTTARILQELLARSEGEPRVELVATDGFLYSLSELHKRGIVGRKGFPESYDTRALVQFVADLKSGRAEVRAPVYSHVTYDIVPGEHQIVRQPDILIIEGLNVLQMEHRTPEDIAAGTPSLTFVSDFFDSSIYVDADERHIEEWYVERFMTLRATVFQDDDSFFHRFAKLTEEEARKTAHQIWRSINLANLHENILPTRERTHVILEKGPAHDIQRVRLRRM